MTPLPFPSTAIGAPMRVLITGAAGWIARHLTSVLAEAGHELRLTDRVDPAQATVFVPGTAEREAAPLVTAWPYLRGEITDEAHMAAACAGCDAVIHLAAATTGLPEHGRAIMEANVVGTWVVAAAAQRAGVGRLLAASSVNAYGSIYWRLSGQPVAYGAMPLIEDVATIAEDPYSLSKHQGEEVLAAFHRAYGLTVASFRFAGVWTDAMWLAARAAPAATTGWSDDLWQWVHVDDVVAGLRAALEHPGLPGCGTYNLGAGDTRCPEPTLELLRRFRPALAASLREPLPGRSPLLSITAARRAFAYAPVRRISDA